jgi:hypothetical protein
MEKPTTKLSAEDRVICYGALDPPVGGTFHFENLVIQSGHSYRNSV